MQPPSPNDSDYWFIEQHDKLFELYDSDPDQLSPEEEASLLPILNSLNIDHERYEEIAFIAEGSEKRITHVFDHRLNRQVAMARAVNANTKQAQEEFLREARLVANLTHSNIPPVYNIGFDPEGIPFFTMELIPGDSLGKIIKKLREGDAIYRKTYPLDSLLSLYLKVCDAIAYAHSRKVLHLDIKPDNIRIGPFGEVFVCDWGLATIIFDPTPIDPETPGELDGDVLNDMALSDIIKGTPGFMAPEQSIATGRKSQQTDIYALGALLYSLLTCERPVRGDRSTKCSKIPVPEKSSRRKPMQKTGTFRAAWLRSL